MCLSALSALTKSVVDVVGVFIHRKAAKAQRNRRDYQPYLKGQAELKSYCVLGSAGLVSLTLKRSPSTLTFTESEPMGFFTPDQFNEVMTRATLKNIVLFLLLVLSISTSIGQTVYVTKTGKKYHEEDCRYLCQSKIETTLSQALDAGYTDCSVCSPPTQVTSLKQTRKQPVRNVVSQQWTGLTKAGNRCKRMTTNANGKCYQH